MALYGFAPLAPEVRTQLEHLWRHGKTPLHRRRCQIVLLAAEMDTQQEIARAARCSLDTVQRTLSLYREGGCDGLSPRPQGARPHRKRTEEWLKELRYALEHSPESCGLPRPTWTAGLLAIYLEQKTGTPVNEHTVRRGIQSLGYVCRRPTWTVRHKAEAQPNYIPKRQGSRHS